jgi:hypothetical protein
MREARQVHGDGSARIPMIGVSGFAIRLRICLKESADFWRNWICGQISTRISILSLNYETSDRRKRQCLYGCERGEGLPEVNTQWVRYKTGLFSFPSMRLSRSACKVLALRLTVG